MITKKQVVNKVKDLEEDNRALWHNVKCFEEEITKIKKEMQRLHEELTKQSHTIKDSERDK